MGKTFVASLPFAGFKIPLPEGTWTVVAFLRGGDLAPANEIVMLARIEDKKLGGLIGINAYQDPKNRGAGFPQTSFCSRNDYLYIESLSNEAFGLQECWWINHAARLWATSQGEMQAAQGELKRLGIELPGAMVNVGFRLSEMNRFITLLVYFNPEEDGISTPSSSWEDSEWNRNRIYQFPGKTAYIKRLTRWGKTWAQTLRENL